MDGKRTGFLSKRRATGSISMVFALGLMAGCNAPPTSDQNLQEQAAKATEAAKKESAEALAQTRVAAANAERAVNDVAAGVKQGLDSKNPGPHGLVDLNGASAADLALLPGVSAIKAGRIIRHRPYSSTHDLVTAGILNESQYEAVAPKITVR